MRTLYASLFLLFLSPLQAQYRHFMTYGEWLDDRPRCAIGIKIGAPSGLGLDFAYRLKPSFSTRFSINYADLKINDYRLSLGSGSASAPQAVLINFHARMSHVEWAFDYAPVRSGRLRLSGGLLYTPINKITVGGMLDDIIKFNDVTLNAQDLGSGTVTLGFQSPVAVFAGLGFGNIFPQEGINCIVDLGATYRGRYTFDILVKEGVLLKRNEENEAVLERNFNARWYYRILPFINFKLCKSLNFKQ